MYAWRPPRTLSAVSSLAIVGAIFALLVLGLNIRPTVAQVSRLISIDLTEPPPPPRAERPPPKPHAQKPAAKHAASPRNVRNKATAVVAPPVKPIVPPPPVVTAPKPGVGAAANNGTSNRPGPGQGAGGIGNGTGGGGLGGEAAGDSVVGPRQTGGRLKYQDLPEGVLNPGQEASVDVLYLVTPDGHATNCRAEHSSGHPVLDGLTCRLIEQRFRFKPALDRYGRPVSAWVAETHTWDAYDPNVR